MPSTMNATRQSILAAIVPEHHSDAMPKGMPSENSANARARRSAG